MILKYQTILQIPLSFIFKMFILKYPAIEFVLSIEEMIDTISERNSLYFSLRSLAGL